MPDAVTPAATVTIRPEEPRDRRAVEELTRDAFWGVGGPRCDEHLLVHVLRQRPSFVPELACVAELDGELVGHVVYTRAVVADPAIGARHDVLTFGPLSVLPAHQSHGIGGALMRHTLRTAANLGHRAVVVYGHPDYYPRFGFRPASGNGITAPGGAGFDALMALALVPGGLDGVTGEFVEDEAFVLDPEQAAAFDRGFPPRPDAVPRPLGAIAPRLPAALAAALREHGVAHLEDLRRFSRAEVTRWPGVRAADADLLRTLLAGHGIRWGTRPAR